MLYFCWDKKTCGWGGVGGGGVLLGTRLAPQQHGKQLAAFAKPKKKQEVERHENA